LYYTHSGMYMCNGVNDVSVPFCFRKRLRQEFLGLAKETSRNQTGGADHVKDEDVDHVEGGDVDQVKGGDVDQVEGGDVRQVTC